MTRRDTNSESDEDLPQDLPQDLTSPEYWDESRKSFQTTRGMMRRRNDRLLAKFIDQLGMDSASVLELGCAPGSTLIELAKLRPQHSFSGVDNAVLGLKHARKLLKEIGAKGTLYEGDLRTLETPERFDFVFSTGLVEHFTDPLPIIQAHVRLCRPGGKVLVEIPNMNGPLCKWFIRRLRPQSLEIHNFETMRVEVMDTLMRQAGLRNVRTGHFGGPRIFHGRFDPTWRNIAYSNFAKAWNLCGMILPTAPFWGHMIWSAGDVGPEGSE